MHPIVGEVSEKGTASSEVNAVTRYNKAESRETQIELFGQVKNTDQDVSERD